MDNYMDYPGCISPSPETFKAFVREVVRDLYKWGARRFFVVNGHGGNTAPLLDVGFEFRRKGALMPVFEWWKNIQTIDSALDKAVNALPSSAVTGKKARTRGTETAVAMVLVPGAQKPESVKVIYSREMFGGDLKTNFATGVHYKGTFVPLPLGSRETTDWGEAGTMATEQMGRQILDECVDFMASFITDMCGRPLPSYSEV
jgi:creatinine amidohydrolase